MSSKENGAAWRSSGGHPYAGWGGFRGALANPDHGSALEEWIGEWENRTSGPDAELIYRLRNRIFKLPELPEVAPSGLCLKAFRRPDFLRSFYYARYPTKAEKSFRYSLYLRERGVGVPEPLAWGGRFVGGRLEDSFLLTAYIESPTDFLGEMARLYREDPDYVTFLKLLRTVANAIRRMHDVGFLHNDLGGQNILVRRIAEREWGEVRFIDLNRGRLVAAASLHQRGRDLAKLDIPSFLREIFFHFYFGDAPIPPEFARSQAFYRARIDWHNRSRKYRHPIRHWLHRKRRIVNLETVPPHRELWLWDEKSGQPAIVLKNRCRSRHRSAADLFPLAWHGLARAPAIWKHYRKSREEAWSRPVSMTRRAGISFEIFGPDLEERLALLREMPGIPVMIRCHHQFGVDGLTRCEAVVRSLAERGHEVSLALIQSRASIRDPEGWAAFVLDALGRLHTHLRFVEIGHAINRVKWGAWNLQEMGRLWEVAQTVRERYPALTLLGPPVNDFEFHYYPPLLGRWKERFDAVSCHLYVDRRGAPENFQGRFSTVEKCALGQAIARAYGREGFYITEVNWPIMGSGDHSPVQASYNLPGTPDHPLHVDEATAAAYMIRFYLISLCSGTSERVWWWRLSARGFGLADDRDGHRKRLGWYALVFFHRHFGAATFLRREEAGPVRVYHFDRGCIAYAMEAAQWLPPVEAVSAHRLDGEPFVHQPGEAMALDGQPVFLIFGQ